MRCVSYKVHGDKLFSWRCKSLFGVNYGFNSSPVQRVIWLTIFFLPPSSAWRCCFSETKRTMPMTTSVPGIYTSRKRLRSHVSATRDSRAAFKRKEKRKILLKRSKHVCCTRRRRNPRKKKEIALIWPLSVRTIKRRKKPCSKDRERAC